MVSRPRWESPVASAEMRAGDGAAAIDFIQQHCRIDKDSVGGKRGDLIRLRDWQQLQLYRLLARRDDGRRKHRVGLLGLPRKNGKSGLGSGVALWAADEGPAGGEVYCCAGDKAQARIVFSTCRQMVELDPELAARVTTYRDELVWPKTETRLRVLSAEAFTKEGLNPTFVLFDEVHVQP
ncbi:MAG: terminase large subunit, partial [Acidimicrobiia bacterium]|nr:terminase large subunit [Acidimicrobiia bacterium]